MSVLGEPYLSYHHDIRGSLYRDMYSYGSLGYSGLGDMARFYLCHSGDRHLPPSGLHLQCGAIMLHVPVTQHHRMQKCWITCCPHLCYHRPPHGHHGTTNCYQVIIIFIIIITLYFVTHLNHFKKCLKHLFKIFLQNFRKCILFFSF